MCPKPNRFAARSLPAVPPQPGFTLPGFSVKSLLQGTTRCSPEDAERPEHGIRCPSQSRSSSLRPATAPAREPQVISTMRAARSPEIGRPVTFGDCEQAHNFVPTQTLAERLAGVKPHRHAPVPAFRKTGVGAQALCATSDHHPAEAAGCQYAIWRSISSMRADFTVVLRSSIPSKKRTDRKAATANRLLGPTPIRAHPACEGCDLIGARMSRPARLLLEHVSQTQPWHRVAD